LKATESFFVHISDPQFGMYRPGDEDYEETALVEKAVERINALAPSFVICTGDLIDVPGSDRQMAHARRMLAKLAPGIPLLITPGNHDIGDVPTPSDLGWYRRRVGRDWFSFNHRRWHFVGLNSCLMAAGELAPADADYQWAWLEDDLESHAGADNTGTIVFMHHPLFLRRSKEMEDYFNLPRPARDRCLDLFRCYGIRTVLAGHLHRCNEAVCGDLSVVVTGPVGMPLGEACSGLRIVRFDDRAIHHRFFALDDVAGQESFVAR
jgi:3',5'-cyclic AMP phosphodiesterase CpdA